MITLERIRPLDLAAPLSPGRPRHVGAASGLVLVDTELFVIADDEHHLAVFSLDPARPGVAYRLLDGDLPAQKGPRKKLKPDWEVLVSLPELSAAGEVTLLAIPSGSQANRATGRLAHMVTGADGRSMPRAPRAIDFGPLYASAAGSLDSLNVEGAILTPNLAVLFHRGDGAHANALIHLDADRAWRTLRSAEPWAGSLIERIEQVDLGAVDGVPLGFTDAILAAGGEELLFLAAAEDTDDAYEDGAVHGSFLGRLSGVGSPRLLALERIDGTAKLEGLAQDPTSGRLYFVSDADDPARASELFATAGS